MLVQSILPAAQDRLVTLDDSALLTRAAKLIGYRTDILAVCGEDGCLVGVITKTDVGDQIGSCEGASCCRPAAIVMTKDMMLCRPEDGLAELWSRMKEKSLKNVPCVDAEARPIGMVTARDLLQALLKESAYEEMLRRYYVMGVGYR